MNPKNIGNAVGELLVSEIQRMVDNDPFKTYALTRASESIMDILEPVPGPIVIDLLRAIANSVELIMQETDKEKN